MVNGVDNGVYERGQVGDEQCRAYKLRLQSKEGVDSEPEDPEQPTPAKKMKTSVDGQSAAASTLVASTEATSTREYPKLTHKALSANDVIESASKPAASVKTSGSAKVTVKDVRAPKRPLHAHPLDDPNFETNKDIVDWSGVEFLHAKQFLKYKCCVELMRFVGKTGMIPGLKKLYDSVVEKRADLSDLPFDTEVLERKLKAQKIIAEKLDKDMMTLTKGKYAEKKKEYSDSVEVNDQLEVEYNEQVASLHFKFSTQVADNRTEYAKNHWQGAKTQTHFQKGNHSEATAKQLGFSVASFTKHMGKEDRNDWWLWVNDSVQLNPSPESFDKLKPALFFATDDAPEAEGFGYFSSITDYQDTKYATMSSAMDENPRWIGCQGSVEAHLDDELFTIFKGGISTHQGAKGQMMVFRNNSRRHGAKEVPFHLCPALWHGSGKTIVWVLMMPVTQCLQEGITMDSLERFLDSDAGAHYMAAHAYVVPIMPKATLYMPAGFASWITSHEIVERKALAGLSQVVQFALMGDFANGVGLSRQLVHCIMSSNHAFLDQKAVSSQMYKNRLEFFQSIFKVPEA